MEAALDWFDALQKAGLKPDIVSYNTLINGWDRRGNSAVHSSLCRSLPLVFAFVPATPLVSVCIPPHPMPLPLLLALPR